MELLQVKLVQMLDQDKIQEVLLHKTIIEVSIWDNVNLINKMIRKRKKRKDAVEMWLLSTGLTI